MIDWARVKDLQDEIGAENFDEVADLFLEEADEAILGLGQTTSAKALESALHFLKGAALNLGFEQLAALCQTGERRAAAGFADVDTGEIVAVYDQSKAAFHLGRGALAAA